MFYFVIGIDNALFSALTSLKAFYYFIYALFPSITTGSLRFFLKSGWPVAAVASPSTSPLLLFDFWLTASGFIYYFMYAES